MNPWPSLSRDVVRGHRSYERSKMTFPEIPIPPAVMESILQQEWTITEKAGSLALLSLVGMGFDYSFMECMPEDQMQEYLARRETIESVLLDHECQKALITLVPMVGKGS